MRHAAHICAYLVTYARPSLADLGDEHLALEPAPNAKTAGWILGHLCVSGDYVRRKLGCTPMTPRDWGPVFAPRTQPAKSSAGYPATMRELVSTFENLYLDLARIAPDVPIEILNGDNPLEYSRSRLPTAGQFFAYIMTGHLGYHLGQLSGWRAAAGLALRPGATSEI
jgi:hypothetical protein